MRAPFPRDTTSVTALMDSQVGVLGVVGEWSAGTGRGEIHVTVEFACTGMYMKVLFTSMG